MQVQVINPEFNNIIEFPAVSKSITKKSGSLYTSDGRIKPHAAEPIKDKKTIADIKSALLASGRYGYRNYMIFTLDLNIGRRCGDLLKLKIGDVYKNGQIVDSFEHIEQKTKKRIEIFLNEDIKEAILEYINSLSEISLDSYLFTSQKGGKLDVRSFYHILAKIKEQLHIEQPMGTHTMRKTMGHYMYQKNKGKSNEYETIDILQTIFGHSDKKTTLKYIGITRENMKSFYNSISL